MQLTSVTTAGDPLLLEGRGVLTSSTPEDKSRSEQRDLHSITIEVLDLENDLRVERNCTSDCEATAYKIAVLAPKLLFAGIGWTVGLTLGANLGAGVGEAVGVLVGSLVSFVVIELIFGRYFGLDSELQKMSKTALAVDRLKGAVITAGGSLLGGFLFNIALFKWAYRIIGKPSQTMIADFAKAVITGVVTTSACLTGSTVFRGVYSIGVKVGVFEPNKEHELSRKNFRDDLIGSIFVTFAAETAFVATALPLFGSKWLLGTRHAALKGGASVVIGGTIGSGVQAVYETCGSSSSDPIESCKAIKIG